MPVTSCRKMRGSSAVFGVPNINQYSDQYRIECDADMSRLIVLTQAQETGSPDKLPKRLEPLNDSGVIDTNSYCQAIKLDQSAEHKQIWIATCEYGPLQPNQTTGDNVPSPIQRPIKWHVEWIEESGVVVKDKDGQPIANTVGDEFDTPLEQPNLYMVLVCEKNFATINDIIALGLEYHNSVNSQLFLGAQTRQAKFLPIQSTPVMMENGIEYFTASLRWAFNPATWDVEILNRGWRYRPAPGQAPVMALDKETRLPVTTPVNLAQDGTLLADNAAKYYVRKRVLGEKDYNTIFA